MGRRAEPLLERLSSYIKKTSSCWIWTGAIDKDGYGKTSYLHKDFMAHRLVYETLVTKIPIGLELDHLCKIPACVNPAHLEPVTRKENAWRNNLCKISRQDAEVIRKKYKTGLTQQTIGKMFGIGQDQVSRIINQKAWSTK